MAPSSSVPTPPSIPSASDFVLDDDLDEDGDEDMLAFQSTRNAAAEAAELAMLTPPHRPKPSSPQPPPTIPLAPQPPIPALALALGPIADVELEITGLPVGCTRADVERLSGPGTLRAIRLGGVSSGVYGPSIVRVSASGAAHALCANATIRNVPVKIVERGLDAKFADVMRDVSEKLPLAEIASATARAQKEAQSAMELAAEKFADWDKQFALSARAGAAGAAVAEAARKLDDATGVSKGANAVVSAASVAAKEVDENWRVSERAREVVNDALSDDRIAPAARAVLGAVTPKEQKRRKSYQPSAERRNPDIDAEDGDPRSALEF